MQTFGDKEKYDGEWKNDKKSGKGVYTHGPKERYEGDWDNDMKNGHGKVVNN